MVDETGRLGGRGVRQLAEAGQVARDALHDHVGDLGVDDHVVMVDAVAEDAVDEGGRVEAAVGVLRLDDHAVGQIGGSGDTLDRLHKMVEEEREKAAGRLRVAKDSMNLGDVQLKEAEQKALADQALADFAAAEGITLDGASAPAPASRTMGPAGMQGETQSQ